MAAAQITGLARSNPSVTEESDTLPDVEVRLGIHDASRLEWSVSIPLPEKAPLGYSINVDLDIPSNAFANHAPWDQLQSFTRLDGPAEAINAGETVSIDSLRRGAVTLANRLSRASDGFARHCRLATSLLVPEVPADLKETLVNWVEGALCMAKEARVRMVTPMAGEAADLLRERNLVDEYVSVRLLEMLASAERSLGKMLV
ncbi:MAG: hypothetical protein ABIP39_14290, partial [Polyangiaceae bacterium]